MVTVKLGQFFEILLQDYVSCALSPNAWYILDWHSSIQYETFHNKSYGKSFHSENEFSGTYWANYTTSYVFQPTDRLSLNGTEGEWLRRLLTIETRYHSISVCQCKPREWVDYVAGQPCSTVLTSSPKTITHTFRSSHHIRFIIDGCVAELSSAESPVPSQSESDPSPLFS